MMHTQVPENPVQKNRDGSANTGANAAPLINASSGNLNPRISPAREHDFTPLVVIVALMVTCYLTANIMAVKLIGAFGVALIDAGTITFPLAYMLGDVLTEIWGFKIARKVIFLTFLCNVILVAATLIGVFIPSPAYLADTAEAYNTVFTYVPRIVAASLAAFLAGELTNAWFMVKIKERTKGRHLWLRTIGSSAIGYIFDTVIFCVVAFAGTVRPRDLFLMIGVQYILKLAIEAACGTPIAYAVIANLKKRFHADAPAEENAHEPLSGDLE